MKWGTWGGQMKFQDGYWRPGHRRRQSRLVCRRRRLQDLNQLAGLTGTASYDGQTIGNVASFQGSTWNTYVATGGVHMDWDFGNRNGNAEHHRLR